MLKSTVITSLPKVIWEEGRVAVLSHTYAIKVSAVVILSVCVSVTRVLCDKTKQCNADILTPYERAITLVFLTPTVVGGRRPLPSEICAQSDSPPSKNADFDRFPLITSQPVRDSEKVQL